MYASLALEWLGRDVDKDLMAVGERPYRRPWVAEITDFDPRSRRILGRAFLQGRTDYAKANSVGSRGVWLYYLLESGRYYEVRHFLTWRDERRYLCTVRGGQVIPITLADLPKEPEWLFQSASAPSA